MSVFDATYIKCYEEDEVLTVAISDDAVDPQGFIIITRLDEEDSASIDACIGLQTAAAEYEMADAIQKVSLSNNKLEIEIKKAYWAHFKSETVVANFKKQNLSERRINILKESLKKILEGSSVVADL